MIWRSRKRLLGLGLELGKEIIAEGVETDQQMQILSDYRCTLHQGYFFSEPVGAGKIETILAARENPQLAASASLN